MEIQIGDGITYCAELFRTKDKMYKRLIREGHGYVVSKAGNDLFYVFNGVRTALVHRRDIIENHNKH